MASYPEEILVQIFSILQPTLNVPYWAWCSEANQSRRSTLAAVCRASKTFHRLTVPLLYHTVEIHTLDSHNNDSGNLTLTGYLTNAKQLLRTLVSNPELAAQVRHIKIEEPEVVPLSGFVSNEESIQFCIDWLHKPVGKWPLQLKDRPRFRSSDISVLPAKLDQQALDQCVVALEELKLPSLLQEHLKDALSIGLEDGEVAVVLALCPNIERLELEVPRGIQRTLIMAAVDELMRRFEQSRTILPLRFSRLKEVALWTTPSTHDTILYTPPYIEPLMRAPNLQSLQAYGMRFSEGDFEPETSPPNPQVTKLHIDDGFADDVGLDYILTRFPSLKELSFQASHRSGIETFYEGIVEALCRHGSNLESFNFIPQIDNVFSPLLDIHSMPKLKHFSVIWDALRDDAFLFRLDGTEAQYRKSWLPAILPRSLESLDILDGNFSSDSTWSRMDKLALCPLMADPRYERLAIIRLEQEVDFTEDLPVGWEKARDGKWIVLKRQL